MSGINFGKYAVLQPVEHRFKDEPDWFWRIKPITSGDELAMQQFMFQDRMREKAAVTMEIAHREIAMTFGGTNIPKTETKDGKEIPVLDKEGNPVPILRENATVGEVEAILRQMPAVMVHEIWKAVGEVNPTWGPSDQLMSSWAS